MFNTPIAYFITFRTYGTWLHGDERGSVDREHNHFGTPLIGENRARKSFEASELVHEPMRFGNAEMGVVRTAIEGVCLHRAWHIDALNVRTEHVHVVTTAERAPERVMNDFKAWSTRRLVEVGLVERGRRVWSRHGSTIYLFTPEKLAEKCRYVLEEQ